MNERDTRQGPAGALGLPGAILDPARARAAFDLRRIPPSAALAALVRHYWFLGWDLEGKPPHPQSTLTLPASNAVVDAREDSVGGVGTKRFDRVLSGRGAVYGALFRPAGLQPFWGRSMHLLTDRSLPFAEVFGASAEPVRAAAFPGGAVDPGPGNDEATVEAYDRFLLARGVALSAEGAEVNDWVALIERDPTIGRVERLSEALGVGVRTLQRAMRHHVGIGPKQIIRRYRLLEASARLHRGEDVDTATLAFELGYADQAHFTRDFAAMIGRAPGRYASAQRGPAR